LLRRPMMQKLHLFPDDVRSLWYWLYYFVNTYNKCCFWEIWNPKKLLIFVAFSLLHCAHSHVTLCNWLSLKHGLDGLPITALQAQCPHFVKFLLVDQERLRPVCSLPGCWFQFFSMLYTVSWLTRRASGICMQGKLHHLSQSMTIFS